MSTAVAAPVAPRRFGLLKKLVFVFLVVVIAFIVIVMLQPNSFRVSRSATMAATPAAPFEQVNDFHKWEKWSPWAKLDPGMKVTYDGPASGVGAIYSWTGNDKVGEGKMTILESQPNERIVIRLEFLKPFPSTNTTEFLFKPEGASTAVSWTMSGECNFISKAFQLFMSMDSMVGKDFENGLAGIKQIVEEKK